VRTPPPAPLPSRAPITSGESRPAPADAPSMMPTPCRTAPRTPPPSIPARELRIAPRLLSLISRPARFPPAAPPTRQIPRLVRSTKPSFRDGVPCREERPGDLLGILGAAIAVAQTDLETGRFRPSGQSSTG